jgi:hypothetical protein
VAELAGWLGDRIIGKTRLLRLASLCQLSQAVLVPLEEPVRTRLDATGPTGHQHQAELRAAKARLEALLAADRDWQQALRRDLLNTTAVISDACRRAERQLRDRFRRRIADWQPGLLEAVTDELDTELRALAAQLATLEWERLQQTLARVDQILGSQEQGLAATLAMTVPDLDHLQDDQAPAAAAARQPDLLQHLAVVRQGSYVGGLLGGAGVAASSLGLSVGAALGPVGILVGTGIGIAFAKKRQRQAEQAADRQQAERIVTERLRDTLTELRAAFDQRWRDREFELTQNYRELISRERDALTQRIQAAEDLQRADATQRQHARQQAEQALLQLQRLRAQAQELHQAIRDQLHKPGTIAGDVAADSHQPSR